MEEQFYFDWQRQEAGVYDGHVRRQILLDLTDDSSDFHHEDEEDTEP